MNPLLEINPAACLFVLGPQLSHKCSRNFKASNDVGAAEQCKREHQTLSSQMSKARIPPATYSSILEVGLNATRFLLSESESERGEGSVEPLLSEIKKLEAEEGVTVAMERLVECMKRKNCYNEWLEKTFSGEERRSNSGYLEEDSSCSNEAQRQNHHSTNCQVVNSTAVESIQHFLNLQKQGALLTCTQYDTILDSIAGTRPVTLQDTETLKHWNRLPTLPSLQEMPHDVQPGKEQHHPHPPVGILHLHGVYTVPSSVRLTDYRRCSEEGIIISSQATARKHQAAVATASSRNDSVSSQGMDILREIFRKRLVIFVGFDRDYFDPLLCGILQILYPDNEPGSLKNPPILLTSMSPSRRQSSIGEQLPSLFLSLMVSEEELYCLSRVISPGSPKNFTVGKGLTDKQSSDGLKVQAFLLFNEKQSFRKLGDVIYQQSKSGEIYVRRDALTVIFDDNKILYGNLVTYGGNGLRQLWRLVFSEGSTLLGKGLMALGLQNAAIIWTNRKPAELGNVTGINSVHTYAAHKAVHTMAMAQQQHSISSSSSSFSATLSSTTPSLSVVENSSISLTPRKEAALTSSSAHKRSLGSLTPAVVPALAACMSVASPSKDYKIEGARESGSSGGGGRNKERERCEGDREGGDIRSFTISRSDSKSSQDGCRHDHKAELSTVVATAPSTPHKSTSTAANVAVSAIPAANFVLSPTGSRTLTSYPISTSSALRLNPTPATALGVAMSTNPLLAAGLNLSALQPGIGTPTGSLGGLVSPILFGNNPFLTVLGASPMTLPKTVAAMTTTKASAMGRVLDTAAAEVATAQFVPSQQTAGVTQNLQLISQLNDKINAQLRMAPGNGCITTASATQMDFNRLLSLAGTGASTLQATAAYSANSGLDPEFSKRERQLEMLMSKTPIHCIAPPPEILSSIHDRLTTEHTIEYIDTLQLKMSNSTKEKKNGISATSSLDKRLTTSSERSSSNSSLRDIRNSKDSEELRVDTDEVLVETPSPSRSRLELSKLPKKESNLSASKRSRSMDSLSRSTSNSSLSVVAAVNVVDTASQSLHQLARTKTTTATAASSLSSGISSLVGSTSVLTAPSLIPTSSLPSSISIPPSLPASVAPLAVPIPPAAATPLPGGFPLLYTVPPTTATGGHMHGLSPSPLKGYYVVYNPLAGAVAAGGGGVVTGNHASAAAVQPFAVIPPQAVSTTNKISNMVQSSTATATGTVPLQVPTGLVSTTGLIPSLGAASLGSVSSPMYYYVPDGSYLNAASGSGLMAATVGAKEEGVVGKRTHIHHQHHRGVSSLVEGSMKAKKRQRSDCNEVVTTEAKRMRTNASDVSWRGELKHRVGSSEDVEVVSEEEHVDVGLGVAKDDFTDSDDEGSGAEGFLMHSADGNKSYTYKTHLQLWEFLLDLLLTPNHGTIIQWTGNDYEFNIVNPEAVVRLWGAHKNKPQMTYEKMSRSLRYYYSQGIMDKVPGKRFTFKFAFDIQKYIIDNKKTSLFTLTS